MFGLFKKKDSPPENHWKQFEGKGDADEVLIEKAKLLAVVLADWTHTGAKHIIDSLQKDLTRDLKPEFGQVFFETILFYLHYTDRLASGYLSAEQRSVFSDALVAAMADVLQEAQPSEQGKDEFRLIFASMYNERQIEYGKYKMTEEKNGGLANTLFWEFEKKIIKILGFDQDIMAMMTVHANITTALKYLAIQSLFETK